MRIYYFTIYHFIKIEINIEKQKEILRNIMSDIKRIELEEQDKKE